MGRQFEFFSYFSHQVEQEEKLYIHIWYTIQNNKIIYHCLQQKRKLKKIVKMKNKRKSLFPDSEGERKKTSEFYDKLNVLLNLCEYENVISKN